MRDPHDRLIRHRHGRLILAAVLLVAFLALARALPEKGGMAFDLMVSDWLGARATDAGHVVFTWVSWLGDTALSGLLVGAVLLLGYHRRFAAAATVTFTSIAAPLIDIQLKELFARGRPDYAIEFITGPTFSFPSGHSMSSLVGFGIIAYFRFRHEKQESRRLLIVVGTCLIVAAVGFSRLYLGAHYVSDVLGGFLAGGVWLLLCIEGYHRAYARRIARAAEMSKPAT